MGWTVDAATGLAQHLATAGVGVWSPTGAYTTGQVAIVVGTQPATPDRVITITPYPVAENPALSDVIQGFQVRCRGDRDLRTVWDLADAVRDALHGARSLDLAGVRIASMYRASHAPLGTDENGRHQTTSNFYATTGHASAHVSD